MSTELKLPKKLIEVALPLKDINQAAAREKHIRRGHPSTLHLWWARRPLAAARAILFSQLVNDPGFQKGNGFKYGMKQKEATAEREKLFDLIRELIQWENSNNADVLRRARQAIEKSWREVCELNRDHPRAKEWFCPEELPAFHDPFAGGGAIPLEAQRLGLTSHAGDLNPVATLINKAMIEIPPKFAGQAPVGPLPAGEGQKRHSQDWPGATGLAEDVRRYGHWLRDKAWQRLGNFYPKVTVTPEMIEQQPELESYRGQELTVIAWLWARTVKSPSPAYSHVEVPLVGSFVLSAKPGKEAYIEPVVSGDGYRFQVRVGKFPETAKSGTKVAKGKFRCLLSGALLDGRYMRKEGKAGRMGARLLAVVAEGKKGRVYLSPVTGMERLAEKAHPEWKPEFSMNQNCTDLVSGRGYGFSAWCDLFTSRQLLALTTFSDLVKEVKTQVRADARAADMNDDDRSLAAGGSGAGAYGEALTVYLACVVDKVADYWSAMCTWNSPRENIRSTFSLQAIPMVWDYAEANPFSSSSGNWLAMVNWVRKALAHTPAAGSAFVRQENAGDQDTSSQKILSIDPPYYDNINYADISDFFYVWLRRSLRDIYPDLFATVATPKAEELVAIAHRHDDNKKQAERFFMTGMQEAIQNLAERGHPAFPVTIYYAYKRSESGEDGTDSVGWVAFLEAVIQAGYAIVGTWPLRTERVNRLNSLGANALSSSIVLVCRKRPEKAGTISFQNFRRQLRDEMPDALRTMIGGAESATPIAPVDLAQAVIGPGIGIFSRYQSVLRPNGDPVGVKDALRRVNEVVSEFLRPESGDFDNDTLFCNAWFEEHGWKTGKYGEAHTLAQGKGTTVKDVQEAGVIVSGGGEVRLLSWRDYPLDWRPESDPRLPVWEALHHLVRSLQKGSEAVTGALLAKIPRDKADIIRLAHHLYKLCVHKELADDARAYNELVSSWHAISDAAGKARLSGTQQQIDI